MYDKSPFNEHGILNLIRLGIMGKKVQDEFTPKQIPWGWGGMNWGSGMPMILTKKKQKKIAKALGASRIGGPNKPVKKPTSLK